MDLVSNDPITIERALSRTGGQVSAVHQPLPLDWNSLGLRGEGSGGTIVPEFFTLSSGSYALVTTVEEDPLRTLIQRIESTFGMTREELAKACKTTRKTIYNWLNHEAEPQARNRQRLFDLDILARDWADAGYPQRQDQLNRPLIDGRTVMDLLADDTIDRELILFAGSRLAIGDVNAVLKDPFNG